MLVTLDSAAAAKKIDHLGMSPFHILTSSANLREDIFKYILSGLDYLEAHQCCWQKDYQGKTCIDYLLEQPRRSNEVSNSMIQMILKKSVQDRLLGWGLESWRLEMSGTIDRICTNEDADANKELVDELYKKCLSMRSMRTYLC
ncbi:unnamed protein product [Cylindrotheca closterium]|uniref:Uncharacterized protein n=1 Tax=Cylindrotheca closterium TaxID=2856 RepID=A0AAD2CP53_9STRA|nr:unnamed protein product [Cylindrotheca closterium]